MLEIGMKAPEFCLPNQDEVEICSRDLAGKWIVFYFYPKDNTPGCTTEACDFSAQKSEFEGLDAIILGVSADTADKHRKFIDKKELTITLLVDEDNSVAKAYDSYGLKKFMGKEYDGIIRSTFIISPEGTIAASWTKVRVKEHATIVKEKLQELQNA